MKKEKEEAIKTLVELFSKTKVVYTVLKKVSPSGMSRHISSFVIIDNEPRVIDYQISKILELPLKDDGVLISGCGMDMGFHLVYSLGSTIFELEGGD